MTDHIPELRPGDLVQLPSGLTGILLRRGTSLASGGITINQSWIVGLGIGQELHVRDSDELAPMVLPGSDRAANFGRWLKG